ncbi:Ubiquitin-like-specific protease 2 [Grifola frondosa]|uniref:Ubiquitin-like-specific protease 2 n=1 Tax=Grifola frondosa TaxID=5627 RepID=A0A1C7LKJ3_GRIFR|nr:Ubiquitin-like-specific protease 2 [Grifola frondosa]
MGPQRQSTENQSVLGDTAAGTWETEDAVVRIGMRREDNTTTAESDSDVSRAIHRWERYRARPRVQEERNASVVESGEDGGNGTKDVLAPKPGGGVVLSVAVIGDSEPCSLAALSSRSCFSIWASCRAHRRIPILTTASSFLHVPAAVSSLPLCLAILTLFSIMDQDEDLDTLMACTLEEDVADSIAKIMCFSSPFPRPASSTTSHVDSPTIKSSIAGSSRSSHPRSLRETPRKPPIAKLPTTRVSRFPPSNCQPMAKPTQDARQPSRKSAGAIISKPSSIRRLGSTRVRSSCDTPMAPIPGPLRSGVENTKGWMACSEKSPGKSAEVENVPHSLSIRAGGAGAVPDPEIKFYYPFSGIGAVKISTREWQLLEANRMVNDSVIEFGLRLWLDEVRADDPHLADATIILSPFFFTQLSEQGYAAARRYINPVDVFTKAFIIVPIHDKKRSHWFLAIVTYPGSIFGAPPNSYTTLFSVKGAQRIGWAVPPETVQVAQPSNLPCVPGSSGKEAEGIFMLPSEVHVKVPQQPARSLDCGLYLLHYVRVFMARPLYFLADVFLPNKLIPANELDSIWAVDMINDMRSTLRTKISTLNEEWRLQFASSNS